MKYCSSCHKTKKETEFYIDSSKEDGLRTRCKTCDKKYSKEFYQENLYWSRKKMKNYARENKEQNKKTFNKWKSENPEQYKELQRKYKADPQSKLAARLAKNLQIKWKEIGMSAKDFIIHIQGQWKEGMDWDNYKTVWDIKRAVGGGFETVTK